MHTQKIVSEVMTVPNIRAGRHWLRIIRLACVVEVIFDRALDDSCERLSALEDINAS